MKKNIEITIDLTKGEAEFWKQIEEAHTDLQSMKQRPSFWQRVKSWF